MSWSLLVVVGIILVALAFDYINGFHDAANSIATVVSTRVLTPMQAVVWAAFFNFVAAFGFGVQVAKTVGKGVVDAGVVDQWVILGGLCGAIAWNLITWYYGIPSSSSHALIGGFAGAAVAKAGFGALLLPGLLKILVFIVLAPVIGLAMGFALMVATLWIFRRFRPSRVDGLFRRLQLVSAAFYSLGHGTNDAQKTMGIIAALLYASIWKSEQGAFMAGSIGFPFWIVLVCHLAIGLGTLAGGRRIIKTMAMRLTKLRPYQGSCAETAAAISLFGTSELGIPVSTTHTIVGAIVGVGAVQKLSAVRWGIASRVVWAWILTIPASGVMALMAYVLIAAIHALAATFFQL
jgi:PiT family inorganic phosphate transporter